MRIEFKIESINTTLPPKLTNLLRQDPSLFEICWINGSQVLSFLGLASYREAQIDERDWTNPTMEETLDEA